MKLPRVSGIDVVKVLTKRGFYIRHRVGSHVVLRRDTPFAQTVVPQHHELDKGTLRAILKQTGFSLEDFGELL
ncbi:MAG TPA: type II toxin-antitoxin system HicA family toxin [Candidatus Nanoarchaeia archaeon]|nr:type II toxin-antitoxin system HicA family toxin [Candidatus Nanoarchaeia archaeon]